MRVKRQTKFILAVSLQVVIILLIVGFKLAVLGSGSEIILKVRPLDPRDILRGDYMVFQYNISDAPVYLAQGQQIEKGQVVYVVLRPLNSGKYWVVKSIQQKRPIGNNEIFIRGKVVSGSTNNQTLPLKPSDRRVLGKQDLHIIYGIEEYYIPEGKGRNVDFWHKDVLAKVRVADDGGAVLEQIYVDGQPWP